MTVNTPPYSSLNNKLSLKLSIVVSLLMTLFTFARFFLEDKHPRFEDYIQNLDIMTYEPSIYHIVICFLGGVVNFFLLYEICFWILRKKLKRLRKYFMTFFGTFGVASLICFIFFKTVLQFSQNIPDFHNHLLHIFHNHVLHIGLVLSLIVFLSTLYISSFIRNQQTLLENQRLVAENILNRHEALKNQLNPHFLFNSLNTLDGLIGFDNEKAHSYLHNLSSTFRYTIQNKEITTLKDELSFVESYAYLMKIRYGDNFCIEYAVDERYNHYYITPLSLQVLMENAIKHNIVNDRHPLTLRIETTERDTIRISNAIQPKINKSSGEGIGLANLIERYRLLFGMEIIVTKDGNFTVEIPLIRKIS